MQLQTRDYLWMAVGKRKKNYSRSWHRGNTSSGIISPVIWIDNILTMKKKERTICVGTKKRNPKRHKVSDRNEIKREQTKKKDKLNTLLYLGILSKTDFLYILSLSLVYTTYFSLSQEPPPPLSLGKRKESRGRIDLASCSLISEAREYPHKRDKQSSVIIIKSPSALLFL